MSLLFTPDGNVKHWPTVLVGVVAPVVMATNSAYGVFTYSSKEVTALTLPIAGTLVALALPAAQLAQGALNDFLSTAEELIVADEPIPDVHNYLAKNLAQVRVVLQGTRCVVIYGIISFFLGMLGALGFLNDMEVITALLARNLIACASVVFLIIAVLWFIPVVISAFDFSRGDKLLKLLEKMPVKAPQLGTEHIEGASVPKPLKAAVPPTPANQAKPDRPAA